MQSSSKLILNNLLRRRLVQNAATMTINNNKNALFSLRPIGIVSNNTYVTTCYNNNGSGTNINNLQPQPQQQHKQHDTIISMTTTTTQKRWRHSGKMGKRLETLDELAHEPEREAAQERRKKKKERKTAKKQKGKKGAVAEEPAVAAPVVHNNNDDDLWNDDDDDDDDDFGLDDDDDDNDDEDQEPTLPDMDRVNDQMSTMIMKFEESLKSIRGAEPTADMFDDVQVNAYGSMTPLKAVGQVVIVSHTLAQITCFDPAVAKDVSKAIQLALSLNPQLEEGGMVKVPLPRVSMEVREQTVKQLKKKAESCRQRLRKVRRKAMDLVKKGKDGKLVGISKDDAFTSGKQVEAATESAMASLQEVVDKKMEAIMAV